MLLILPIEDCPSPLVNGTHRKWRKLVKDLGVPWRYIMQKLTISMLNLSDELHIEVCRVLTCFFLLFWLHCYCWRSLYVYQAVIDNARKATTWKEFTLEASCCTDYTDPGKMLVKLKIVNLRTLFHVDISWSISSTLRCFWPLMISNTFDLFSCLLIVSWIFPMWLTMPYLLTTLHAYLFCIPFFLSCYWMNHIQSCLPYAVI
jgi:hypothetical protein